MMRLLFLCLLLLLPAASAASEDTEGSGVDEMDDEDLTTKKGVAIPNSGGSSVLDKTTGEEDKSGVAIPNSGGSTVLDKTTGEEDKSDQLTVIIIIVAVCVLALSVATIITVLFVRRRMHSRQQGIYSVPAEQDNKGPV
ncbi:uncharacterized protein si:dkey-262k9.2 isoform X1 [Pleuronectes platessa]|uniref:uncharacterized protein si:dkey-262k9.2 isoform X1 n=1 Tax=Pleuronectes platessa TaxID=8262 RepID=UPI00232A110C|nr:uncharacterized protein si:dkey-262k9.2 isoform X1 [Pleuronectes platessa]XP_053289543.1 uncharacterized protein si:dkey-262k9.2 isoform X1 [Pleuronectes platessa]XP_053289544.1 uncharacterized protein si:dkey-262k9.2 isoform X1 [Pleuronectes platessa]